MFWDNTKIPCTCALALSSGLLMLNCSILSSFSSIQKSGASCFVVVFSLGFSVSYNLETFPISDESPFRISPSRCGTPKRSCPVCVSTARSLASWARYNTVFSFTVSRSTKSEDNSASSADSFVSCCGSPHFGCRSIRRWSPVAFKWRW